MNRLLFALLLLAGIPAQAEIYRWVDEQGRVQFSDRPQSQEAEPVELETSPSLYSDDPAQERQRRAKQQKMLEMYQDDRDQRSRLDAEQKRDAEERKRRCAYARDRLRRYQSRALYEPQANGERRYLSDSERDEVIAETRREVAHWCR